MQKDITRLYRDRLAKEKGTIKKDWGGRLSVALAFPSQYPLGMSNLGFQIVYRHLNERANVLAERFFLPDGHEMHFYVHSKEALCSLESQRPMKDFDLVAFSLSFENDYANILRMLEMGKIPILSKERGENHPFVMAGGVAVFLNPEPVAPFVDFFLLGEAENCLGDFLDAFLDLKAHGAKRQTALLKLAKNVPGLYAPSLYQVEYQKDGTQKPLVPLKAGVPEKIRVVHAPQGGFKDHDMPISCITTPDTEFGNRILLEIGRGCGHSCRFCAAGYVYRPPRTYDPSVLQKGITEALAQCPQVGLISPAVNDTPEIENLLAMICDGGNSFSVSSLRAESLTVKMLEYLRQSGQKTVAIAPEAGTQRLRDIINKHLNEEQIIDAVRMISTVSPFSIRFYFLMGLPGETDQDIREMAAMVKRLKHHMVKASAARGQIGHIKLSVNCFIPKPFTPFQWFPMEDIDALKKKQKRLKKALIRSGGITVNTDVPKWAYVQALLSLGDRRVAPILKRAHELRGDWKTAMRFSKINPDFFVYRPKGLDEVLPWDFIDHGVSKKHLKREYQLALDEKESDICRIGECFRCGACRVPNDPKEEMQHA